MAKSAHLPEDRELARLKEQQLDLFAQTRQMEELRLRIQRDRAESEATIPPMDEILIREALREHQNKVSRKEIENTRRDQSSGLLLLFALCAATAALIWWGWTLMQG